MATGTAQLLLTALVVHGFLLKTGESQTLKSCTTDEQKYAPANCPTGHQANGCCWKNGVKDRIPLDLSIIPSDSRGDTKNLFCNLHGAYCLYADTIGKVADYIAIATALKTGGLSLAAMTYIKKEIEGKLKCDKPDEIYCTDDVDKAGFSGAPVTKPTGILTAVTVGTTVGIALGHGL